MTRILVVRRPLNSHRAKNTLPGIIDAPTARILFVTLRKLRCESPHRKIDGSASRSLPRMIRP